MTSLRDAVLADRELPDEGDPFLPERWTEYPLPYQDEIAALGTLLREHVFDAMKESLHKGMIFALVWGYQGGKTHGKSASAEKQEATLQWAMAHPDVLLDAIQRLRYAPRNARETIRRLNQQPGVSSASTSKVAYFARLEAREGNCLIFDRQVAKAIYKLDLPELAPLREALFPPSAIKADERKTISFVAQSSSSYQPYLSGIYDLSRTLGRGIDGEDIERFLFRQGRILG